MPPKSKSCFECFKRAKANPTGRSICNKRNPCKWCSSHKTDCTYDYNLDSDNASNTETLSTNTTVPCLNEAPTVSLATPPRSETSVNIVEATYCKDTKMFISDHGDGKVMLRFEPDPENLGLFDPDEVDEVEIDPHELPAENYRILTHAFKRKRAQQLTFFEDAPSVAKRIRGGADHALADDIDDGEAALPPAAPVPEPAAPAPALPALHGAANQPADPVAALLQSVVESSKANNEMFLQFMNKFNKDDSRRAPMRPSILSKKLHNLDVVDEDETLSKVDAMIPRQMIRIFENGWVSDFSMHMLTDTYCESPEANKVVGDKLIIGTGNSIYTQPSDLSLAARDPTTLTLADFMQAAPRFILLVKNHLSVDLAEAWQMHCDRILNHTRRDKIWHLLMLYDAAIRRRATKEPLRPDNWHEDVFTQIEEDWNRKQFEARGRALDARAAAIDAQLANLSSHTARSGNPQSQLLNSSRQRNDVLSHRPSNLASTPSTGHYSFRSGPKQFPTDSNHEPRKTRCFICARCTAKTVSAHMRQWALMGAHEEGSAEANPPLPERFWSRDECSGAVTSLAQRGLWSAQEHKLSPIWSPY